MSPPRYDLEVVDGKLFRDGKILEASLGNAVDVLRERYPDANIVLSPGLAKLKVSDLKLRAGRLEDELEALRIASGEKFGVQAHVGPNGPIDPATGLPTHGNKAASDLFILKGEVSSHETTRTIEAFNIDPYLQWVEHKSAKQEEDVPKSLEELNSMIRDAILQLNPNGFIESDFPSFSFHSGAHVLVVTGTQQAVEVARKIIRALPGEEVLQASFVGDRLRLVTTPEAREAEAADEAFRKRYGLKPRPASTAVPEKSPPTTEPPR